MRKSRLRPHLINFDKMPKTVANYSAYNAVDIKIIDNDDADHMQMFCSLDHQCQNFSPQPLF